MHLLGKSKRLLVLILAFLLTSLIVSIFNSRYYSTEILDVKASEIEDYFNSEGDFSSNAKALLRVRPDVISLTLIDSTGIVRQSFGGASGEIKKKYTLSAPGDHTIILGLKKSTKTKSLAGAVFWGFIIAAIVLLLYFAALRFLPSEEYNYLKRFRRAVKSVSNGDYSVRLVTSKSQLKSPVLVELSESFNFMVEQIAKRLGLDPIPPQFQPDIGPSHDLMGDYSKNAVTLVSRVSSQGLQFNMAADEYSKFLDQYRREASSIIFKYGGVIESVSGGEIVAFFNVPNEVNLPELRAVSSAVEVLQLLAKLNKLRNLESDEAISGKVGLGLKNVLIDHETGLPHDIDTVISPVKQVCDDAESWKVMITSEVYDAVTDHVEVKEPGLGPQTVYSVLAVEEGIV